MPAQAGRGLLIAATVVAILLGFAGVLWQWRRATNARAEASQRQTPKPIPAPARSLTAWSSGWPRSWPSHAHGTVAPQIIEEALQFYERFLSQGEDPTVRHGTALAYLRVGGIYDTLGDTNAWRRSKGIAMLEDLAQRRPVEAGTVRKWPAHITRWGS